MKKSTLQILSDLGKALFVSIATGIVLQVLGAPIAQAVTRWSVPVFLLALLLLVTVRFVEEKRARPSDETVLGFSKIRTRIWLELRSDLHNTQQSIDSIRAALGGQKEQPQNIVLVPKSKLLVDEKDLQVISGFDHKFAAHLKNYFVALDELKFTWNSTARKGSTGRLLRLCKGLEKTTNQILGFMNSME